MIDLHGISRASFDLIVNEEVSGEAAYNKRYRHPEWPGEQSGVTIGIGYDVGTQKPKQVRADWQGKIPDDMLKAVVKCCGVTGPKARPLAVQLRGVVDVPWEIALDVFSNRDIPRYLGILLREIPEAANLGPDCLGVMLSLTFNRDAAGFHKPGPRYAEMRQIRACIKTGDLARVPGLFRSMRRLWPKTSGLYGRREREAALFEKGLQEFHPQHFAAMAELPAPVDPEVVARVQEQLRNLGYYQVGSIDGSLTPKGKTEDAILAFRNKNGLPLTPTIDDDFLNSLAKAQPPEQAEERANATVHDLREQGSETIGFTDKVKSWGGRLFGGGSATGLVALVTEKASAISSARDAVGGLGIPAEGWVIIAGAVLAAVLLASMGLAIWYVADRIEQKRLADYRIGKNP